MQFFTIILKNLNKVILVFHDVHSKAVGTSTQRNDPGSDQKHKHLLE